MRTHRRRIAAAIIAAVFLPLYGSAAVFAVPADPGKTANPRVTFAPKIGDTPAEFAQPVAPAPKAGDTPADDPGASRAPQYQPPTTIEVVRPERTIVRDVDGALPIVLGSLALLVALGGFGFALVRTRTPRRAAS